MNVVSDFDLIFCCETWQKSKDKYHIANYDCIDVGRPESLKLKGRTKRGHGGICLFVRQAISKGIEILEKDSRGFVWVKVCKTFLGAKT